MRRYHPDILALGAIIAFASLLFSINDSWMFVNVETSAGIDPFIYRGYFMNLAEHLKTFEGLYYTSRLPPILIGAAFQSLPDQVGVVLMRMLYSGASAFSVYVAVSRLTGNRIAGLATVIVLLTDTYALSAFGSDYVNGAAFTFLSIGAAALIAASVADGQRKWLSLLVAGAALATAVATHILSLMPAAFLGVLFLLLSKGRLGFASLLWLGAAIMIGAAVALGVFGLVSLYMGGQFLFFLPQFVTAPGVATTWMPMNRPSGLAFVLERPWNWLHFLVAAVSIFVLVLWKAPQDAWAPRARAALAIQIAFIGLCFLSELFGLGVLRGSINYVYPEVLTIIAIGALFGIALRNESQKNQLIALASMAVLSVCLWLGFRIGLVSNDYATVVQRNSVIAGVVLVAAAALAKNGPLRVMALSAVAAAWLVLSIAFSNNNAFDARGGAEAKRSFLAFLALSRSVNEFSPPEARYWYDAHSAEVLSDKQRTGLARIFMAHIATRLYGYSIVSDTFPRTQHPFTGKVEILDSDFLVALSAECHSPELTAKALDAAGYWITSRSRQTFEFNGTSICGERMKVSAKLEPVGRMTNRFELSDIKPSSGADVSFSMGTLKVTTPGCRFCDGVRVPIPRQQRSAIVRVKLRVDSGSIGVGLGDSIDPSKLEQERILKAQPHERTVDIQVDNKSDTDVISVRTMAVRGPSRATIESIALHEIDTTAK